MNSRQMVIGFLFGLVLGLLLHGKPATAQNPHQLYIATPAGPTLAQGTGSGVLTVIGQ